MRVRASLVRILGEWTQGSNEDASRRESAPGHYPPFPAPMRVTAILSRSGRRASAPCSSPISQPMAIRFLWGRPPTFSLYGPRETCRAGKDQDLVALEIGSRGDGGVTEASDKIEAVRAESISRFLQLWTIWRRGA
jgi:hypothetical protein